MEDRDNSQTNFGKPAVYSYEVDLRELFMVLWKGKWVVVTITFVSALISVIYALSLPNIYRAEALLAPANGEEAGGLNALASQYGGLASLAGINLGLSGSKADKTVLGIEILRSRKFIGEFVERHDILVPLMGSNDWSLSENRLEYDSKIYDELGKEWVRKVDFPRISKPSYLEAHEAFNEILNISQDVETSFVKISVEFFSPHIAKQWVDWLVEDINREIKLQDVSEAEKSIAYLQEQLNTTSLADLQTIFYQLIEEQTKTIMLANASPEYLFRTLDPAVVSEEKAKPNRALLCIIVTVTGFLTAIVFLVILWLIKSPA